MFAPPDAAPGDNRVVTTTPASRAVVACPDWMESAVDWTRSYAAGAERMRLTIELARLNVLHATGGPFGAAVFERDTGALISVGVNSVVRLSNSTLHGEMVAMMLAEQRLGSFSLADSPLARYELFSSCDPCAMCLGALLWSGVGRIVLGANRADASALGFDEGPVFPESYAYLEARGVEIERGLLRDDAQAVLELYRREGGQIYNK